MNKKELEHIISGFKPITLKEMDSVKLMNRTDTKFIFELKKLPKLLQEVQDSYAVLHVENNPFQEYETVYYDTNDKKMYHIHQNGKVNRYKVRHRTYLSSGIAFLECKYKNNKKVTFKKRIPYDISQGLEHAEEFLQKHTPFHWNELFPNSIVYYKRITLVNLHAGERITIDIDLSVTNHESGKKIHFSHLCIIELKREKGKSKTEMAHALLRNRIFKKSMSKYAIGTAASSDEVRVNRFKRKLRLIDKLKIK